MTAVVHRSPWRGGRFSVRWSVVAIVALTIAPVLLLTGWLATWLARSEQAQLGQSAESQVREVVAAIDREIVSTLNVLTTLASSPFLQSGSVEEFYNQAAEVSRNVGLQFTLRDHPLGRQVVNTSLPWGASLTDGIPAPRTEIEAELLRAGRPFISDVFLAPLIKQYVVAVIVPVLHGGNMRYSLASGVPLDRFGAILNSLDFHPDQLVTVIDRSGVVVARSARHNEFAGTQIRSGWPLNTGKVGRSMNREGIPFHWFNRQSEVTGWYFSVGIPDRVFEAPAARAQATFAAAGSVLLIVAIAISYRWGGHLARSAGALGIDRKPTREEFEVLFEAAPNGVMVMSDDGIVMLVNKRIEMKFGYADGELVGQPVEMLVPERLRGAHRQLRSEFAHDPKLRPMGVGRALFGRRKDGSEFPVEIALNPISTGAGNLVMATVVDISARKLAEAKLSAVLKERDDLRRRYMQAQESERLRLAHELHDQTGQGLTAAMLELKGIESLAEDSERERLRSLRKQMEGIGETLHRVAWELRPLSIDEVGLAGALGNYLSEWSVRYGIEADFYCRDSRLDDLPDEIRTTIYRVVQEALTNVAKHAQKATEISVVIERAEATLRLTIDDNGCGFDADSLRGEGAAGGLGIAGMRERLSLIGGEIEIESAVQSGTTIFARIPIQQEGGST